jgi:hypothetical protein
VKSFTNIKKKNNITFGIIFFIFFLIVGLYPLISNEPIRISSVIVSLVFLIITIIRPNLLTSLNKLWIKFGILLGKIISPFVMGLVFFFCRNADWDTYEIIKKRCYGFKKRSIFLLDY